MFDTMKVARRIREARIARNLTQMNLADELGISYQAVSNWERGNSMPDISKLEEICNILKISIADLLGQEAQQEARTIQQILNEESVSNEALTRVAPVLTPRQISRTIRVHGPGKPNLSNIAELAPFLDAETLAELVSDLPVDNLYTLHGLAPFLDTQTLDKLVQKYVGTVGDLTALDGLAPFLGKETLDRLAQRYDGNCDLYTLAGLAPFLSPETLDGLADRANSTGDFYTLASLAPFLSQQALSKLAEPQIEAGEFEGLHCLAPFLPKDVLRRAVLKMMEHQDLDELKEIIPFT